MAHSKLTSGRALALSQLRFPAATANSSSIQLTCTATQCCLPSGLTVRRNARFSRRPITSRSWSSATGMLTAQT
jgi:hypothetical protein